MAAFASSAFSVRAFSPAAFSFDVQDAVARVGGWFYYPQYKRRTAEEIKRERIKLGIIPDDVQKAVVRAVEATQEARKVADVAIDLQAAEMELRAYLAQVQKEMVSEYLALLALEFARMEQEFEDFQIAMLLFEM